MSNDATSASSNTCVLDEKQRQALFALLVEEATTRHDIERAFDELDVAAYEELMSIAIQCESIDGVEVMLERGVEINQSILGGQFTYLVMAVMKDNIEIVKLLLEKGADPNLAPLMAAYMAPALTAGSMGQHEVFDLLIEHGADLEVGINEQGSTKDILVKKSDDEQLISRIEQHLLEKRTAAAGLGRARPVGRL